MPELEYFLVAESHAVDRDTNSISIFNVLTERKFLTFPHELPRFVLVSCWYASDVEIERGEDQQASIRITLPNGQIEGPFNANFRCDSIFYHVLLEYENLLIPEPGLVMIELLLNGKEIAKHRIMAMGV